MSEGGREGAGRRAVEESVRWPSMAAMEHEPDQTWHCNLLSTVDVPNSVESLILIGHLQLSGVRVGTTPRTHTKNTCELKKRLEYV